MGKRMGRPPRGEYKRMMILFSLENAEFLYLYCKVTGKPLTRVVEEAFVAHKPAMTEQMSEITEK